MKLGKAKGPYSMSVGLLAALEDYGIAKITTLLNDIYDTRQIPLDISKLFIALPKKPWTTECELHGMISFMSHVTKIPS